MSEESTDIEAELEKIDKQVKRWRDLIPKEGKKLITIPEALVVANRLADARKIKGYKTEKLLARALRTNGLIYTRQRFADGKTMHDWIRSEAPDEPKFEDEEVTSEPAVAELFQLKAEQKRRLDRERKRRKGKISKKNFATSANKKRKASSKKRNNSWGKRKHSPKRRKSHQ